MAIGIKPSEKIWISNLINGTYKKQLGEFESNYVLVKDKQVFKVNIVATVINKFQSTDGKYVSLTIDDNTAIIRIKAWNEDTKKIINFEIGDLVLVIAKPREYNEELYLIPSTVKKVEDPNLELMYRAEILKNHGKPESIIPKETPQLEEVKEEKIEKEDETETTRRSIISLIEKKSTEEGVRVDDIILSSGLPEQ
ncbi:MAG: OB-fold nucleic acid binding domain-containing protein [Candidatus Nanoarchaeia archaeon]|nr:OB-fold nucleic acid binding domain-containing protein [Candidatus Nanoarchaeia archaeon]